MNGEPKTRMMREVTERQDKALRILEAVKYATVENIKIKDGQIRMMDVRLRIDFDNPEDFKKAIEELKSIPLL